MRGNKCRLDAVKAGSGSSGLSRGMPSMSMLFPGVSVRVLSRGLTKVGRLSLNVGSTVPWVEVLDGIRSRK